MIDARLSLAIKYHQDSNLEKAREIYQEIINENPNQIEALHLLSILEAQAQNFSLALSLIERAITLNAKIPALYNSCGNIYKKLGKLEEAKLQYEKVLQLDPDSPTAHNNLANILYLLNHIDQAINLYRLAIQLKPDYADAHYNLGLALLFRQELNADQEAILEFTKTIELDAEYVEAINQLAQVSYKQSQPDKAIEYYRLALKIDPNNLSAKQNLGAILSQQRDFSTAIQHLEDALKLAPKHIETLHNLGAIFLEQRNFETALKYFLRLLSLAPTFDVYYNIGTIYIYQNKYGDALQYFREALRIKPDDFATLNNLGAIYLKLEDRAKAVDYYEKALKIKKESEDVAYLLDALKQSKGPTLPEAAPAEYLQHLFDQYAPYFEAHLVDFLQYRVPDLLFDAVTRQIEKPLASIKWIILDLGCGTGLLGVKFRQVAKKLIGIDISEKILEVARQKNIYDELLQLDITIALGNYNADVDLILAADSLVYTGNLEQVFAKSSHALKADGYFAFTCETTDTYPYILQTSARFAHSTKYLDQLIKKYKFTIKHQAKIVLRKEKDMSIPGLIYVLQH